MLERGKRRAIEEAGLAGEPIRIRVRANTEQQNLEHGEGGIEPADHLCKQGRPLRILVVEADPLIALDLCAIVADQGGEVVAATALGEDAIARVADCQPDVVLTEVALAGDLDGIEAAQQIRRWFGTPMIFVTTCDDLDIAARIVAVSGHPPVHKPVSVDGLRNAILRACGLIT
jgi:CheY-like chemotaxis protein